jgi:hypothetical protein
MSSQNTLSLLVLAAALGIGGCVDSPTAASGVEENQLAASFDNLAQDRLAAGDSEQGEEFRWAALALRLGIAPTRFQVVRNGVAEVYNAFVHAARWPSPLLASRPPSHRSFVAWRKTGELLQVILLATHLDEAPILHPYSMRVAPGTQQSIPLAGAHAAYFERGRSAAEWIGIAGRAKIVLESSGDPCYVPKPGSAPAGVTCVLARWNVAFNATMVPVRSKPRDVDERAPAMTLLAAEQEVAGALLTFTCPAPSSLRGCSG